MGVGESQFLSLPFHISVFNGFGSSEESELEGPTFNL